MSTASTTATDPYRTATRRLPAPAPRNRLRPDRAQSADAAFLLVACMTALYALRGSYAGWAYLAVGLAGLVVGLLAAHLSAIATRSVLVAAVAAVAGYSLVGPSALSAGAGTALVAPTPSALSSLASIAVHCWKDLLTTQPPVGNTEPLLAVPFLLGLAGGALGTALARRTASVPAPLVAPAAILVLALALGTDQTSSWLVTAVLLTAVLLAWTATRSQRARDRRAVAARSARVLRIGIATALILVSGAVAAAAEPALPGAGNNSGANAGTGTTARSVLRSRVAPPLDLADYPSPLAGFHKYTKDANQVWDQQLLKVTGLPSGVPIELSVLDDYDGWVWGAVNPSTGDEFHHVGSTLQPSSGTATGPASTVRITIDPAYAALTDLDAWLPTAGNVTAVSLGGADPESLTGSLWYNSATGSGIVTSRLQGGDTVTLRTTLGQPTLTAADQPYQASGLTDGYQSLFAARAASWDKGSTGAAAQVEAVAAYLKQNGAYSDGGPGQSEYLPGHGIGRLANFLNGPQPVGDDEQYAATLALMADSLGIPARVVLGAVPEADGVVRGSDIHAWVQVRIVSGAWANIPYTQFMPNQTKVPAPLPPQTSHNAAGAVVPPPQPAQPPSSPVGSGPTDIRAPGHTNAAPPLIPAWLVRLLELLALIASPVLVLLAVAGLIRGGKAYRRRRRRTRGPVPDRFAAGWLDLADHARDLGCPVPARSTRQQQARLLDADHPGAGLGQLARAADAAVHGPGDPAADLAAAYWRQLDGARVKLSKQAGRRRRIRAAFSVASLLPTRSATRPRSAASAIGARFGGPGGLGGRGGPGGLGGLGSGPFARLRPGLATAGAAAPKAGTSTGPGGQR